MDGAIKVERFDNANGFISAINTRPTNKGWKGEERASRQEGDEEWAGTRTWEEAVDKAQRGYAEVVDKVKVEVDRNSNSVFKRVESRLVRPINSFTGGSPNVVRAMMGIPCDMRNMQRIDCKRPGITLIYEAGVNCGISTERIIGAGSRMLALVKLFERDQVPVRLIVSNTCSSRGKLYSCEIVIKEFNSQLNLQKVAYYFAHPSFDRRLFLSWMETAKFIKKHDSVYGYPISNCSSDYEEYRHDIFEKDGSHWFCFKDFSDDDDVVAAYRKLTEK